MKERPILFSSPMVRSIMEGRKSVTRRIVKPQPTPIGASGETFGLHPKFGGGTRPLRTPYGSPGDRLWVRETWSAVPLAGAGDFWNFKYAADGAVQELFIPVDDWMPPKSVRRGKNAPGIFLPRWASRITLEVTGVRVERLHDIDDPAAQAEGALWHDGGGVGHSGWRHDPDDGVVWDTARASFARLWQRINGAESWDANPWVWVVSFKHVENAVEGARAA